MIGLGEKSQLKNWKILDEKIELKKVPFAVSAVSLTTGKDEKVEFSRIISSDWVNVVPISPDGKTVFLVRQYRVGSGVLF